MKRHALIAALLALSLSACGNKPAETTEAPAPAATTEAPAAADPAQAPAAADSKETPATQPDK